MKHTEFFTHADGIRQAITDAIGDYLAQNSIPYSEEALLDESGSDIEDLSKMALFYGAEVFPDAPDP